MNEGQTKDYETTARLCAVSGSCLVQLPRSFIDSFIKGRTNLRVEYNAMMRANQCRCVPSTLQQPLSSRAQLRYRACILCLTTPSRHWPRHTATQHCNTLPRAPCGTTTHDVFFFIYIYIYIYIYMTMLFLLLTCDVNVKYPPSISGPGSLSGPQKNSK